MRSSPIKKVMGLFPNGLSVAPNCVIPKKNVIGMFDIKVSRIKLLAQKLEAQDKLVDVTSRTGRKSLILLSTGEGILSAFTVRELWENFTWRPRRENNGVSEENDSEKVESFSVRKRNAT